MASSDHDRGTRRPGPAALARGSLSLLFVVLALLSLTEAVDSRSSAHVEQGLQRSLLTFAVARGLNAAISVAQGTELVIQPVGVGVTLTPGEILDPVNDLVERFSWLMLGASAAFGVKLVVIELSAWRPFAWTTALLLLGAALAPWWVRTPGNLRQWLVKAAILLAFLRFTVPVAALASDFVYRQFLEPSYQAASSGLEQASARVERLSAEDTSRQQADAGWWQRLRDDTVAAFDVKERLARYRAAVEDAARQTLDLIVVFTVQTLLVPLLVVVGCWQAARAILTHRLTVFDPPR